MLDAKKVQDEAAAEIREEKMKKAKESLKALYRKQDAAKQVLHNIEREIADAVAELGHTS